MPKIIDHDQQRASLLDRAFAAYAQYGYASLSMRKLASLIGVSDGSLYHYFPSKEALYHSLVERYVNIQYETIRLPEGNDMTLREQLIYVAQQLEKHETEVANWMAIQMDYVQVTGKPFVSEAGQTIDDLFVTQIEQPQRLPSHISRLFRQQAIGLLILRRLTPTQESFALALHPLIDVLAP